MYIKFSERAGEQKLVRDFLISNPCSISVFENYGQYYSCSGNKILKEVCSQNGVDVNKVYLQLIDSSKETNPEMEKFYKWDLRTLITHLIESHETEIKIPAFSISKKIDNLINSYGRNYKELKEIELIFSQMLRDILNHIGNEEKFLFHVIRYLIDCKKFNEKPRVGGFKTVKNPLSKMESDHTKIDANLLKIKLLRKELEIKKDLPSEIKDLCNEINEFDKNYQFHLHLENNILFPKSIDLENELLNNDFKGD